jgi:putative ABC transport system ATP-binding protein
MTSTGANQETPLIRVIDLVRIYHIGEIQIPALRGVSLDVYPGEFVAIRGPSGSGKSTFMNLLGCLDHPTSGQYYLDGTDVSTFNVDRRAQVRNRSIGFVFQSFNLLSRTTALENVEVPLLYNGTAPRERDSRALEVLNEVGLSDRAHHYPSQLSGGQQQRVAIARSLITRPRMILADEPTGNLDSRTSVEVMALLQKLNRERGMTVLLVTHEAEISHFTKRDITFRDGRIIEDRVVSDQRDAAEELASMPAAEPMEG